MRLSVLEKLIDQAEQQERDMQRLLAQHQGVLQQQQNQMVMLRTRQQDALTNAIDWNQRLQLQQYVGVLSQQEQIQQQKCISIEHQCQEIRLRLTTCHQRRHSLQSLHQQEQRRLKRQQAKRDRLSAEQSMLNQWLKGEV